MKDKYLFDLLKDYPESIPEESVFENPEIDPDRIEKLVSERISTNKTKPKKKFFKKMFVFVAAAVIFATFTGMAVKRFLDFNMDQPLSQELRDEIIEQEMKDYYEAIYDELDKNKTFGMNNSDGPTHEERSELTIDVSVSAYDTTIRKSSERILDILKKYDKIDKDTKPEDVCDTYEQRFMVTDEDTEKFCNYVQLCIDLFNNDDITEKERVYLELFLEKALVITHSTPNMKFTQDDANTTDSTGRVLGKYKRPIERSENSNKIIGDTYNMIFNTIRSTVGINDINDYDSIKKRVDKARSDGYYGYYDKLETEYDRFKACLILSDYENKKEDQEKAKLDEISQKYYENHNYNDTFEEVRKKFEKSLKREIPTKEEYEKSMKRIKESENESKEYKKYIDKYGDVFFLLQKLDVYTRLKMNEDCFITMQNVLEHFNIMYDCTTDDYYHNCDKFFDFIFLCCDVVKNHRQELTDEELFALRAISVDTTNNFYLFSNSPLHIEYEDYYNNSLQYRNNTEITQKINSRKENMIIKGRKADIKAAELFIYKDTRYNYKSIFMNDNLNPPGFYINLVGRI